ncbi:hypothetical protein V1525DRAFT_411723 [Lipomyces kononenkoae]|uniref:Uncharacterized protein n=1 Tax=Lipomyces kononenkoae TaxID=34357 RepID=A0ACC3SVS3_LIPKO
MDSRRSRASFSLCVLFFHSLLIQLVYPITLETFSFTFLIYPFGPILIARFSAFRTAFGVLNWVCRRVAVCPRLSIRRLDRNWH